MSASTSKAPPRVAAALKMRNVFQHCVRSIIFKLRAFIVDEASSDGVQARYNKGDSP